MWFNNIPSDLSFSASAKNCLTIQISSLASSGRLYEILITGENQSDWAKGYQKTIWYNTPADNFGSIRDIHLAWIKVRERLLVLDMGKRFAFSSDALSVPIVSQMVEDILFTPQGNGTLITWHVYYNLRSYLRPFQSFLKNRIFQNMFYDFARGLSDYAESHP